MGDLRGEGSGGEPGMNGTGAPAGRPPEADHLAAGLYRRALAARARSMLAGQEHEEKTAERVWKLGIALFLVLAAAGFAWLLYVAWRTAH